MGNYMPTTDGVRDTYVRAMRAPGSRAEFDRWLASVKAEAWEAGCNAGHNREHHKNMTEEQAREAWPNPYREVKLANSLDGSAREAVRLLTGFTGAELDELGRFEEEKK